MRAEYDSTVGLRARIFAALVLWLAALAVIVCLPANSAYADSVLMAQAVGNTASTAEKAEFGEWYVGGWDKDSDHLNCYSRLKVTQLGTVTMTVTKPEDDEGEYGQMYFDLTDEDGNDVWWEKTSDAKMKNGSVNYKYSFNLKPGTYVMNMTPAFWVTSGTIEFKYKFDFKADPYVIAEPNGDASSASVLKAGHVYSGYFGSYGNYSHGENVECMTFVAPKEGYYYIKIGNYDKLDSTTWIGKFTIAGKSEDSIRSSKYSMFDKTDSNGFIYGKVYLAKGKRCFIKYENYHGDQIAYKVAIVAKPRVSISKAKVSLGKVQYTSTGKAPKEKPTVTYGGETLELGTDYKLSYSNNKKTGVTTVTITGIKGYKGTKKVTYKVADIRYALLKPGGSIWCCRKDGTSVGKKMSRDLRDEVTTLYIDPAVKTVPEKVNCGGYRYSICIHFDNLRTVVFQTNKKGVSACTSIASSAFSYLSNLKTVKNLQKTKVKIIGSNAFDDCESLTSISVPKTLKTIGSRAFDGCVSLRKIGGLSKKNTRLVLSDDTYRAVRV